MHYVLDKQLEIVETTAKNRGKTFSHRVVYTVNELMKQSVNLYCFVTEVLII